MRRTSAAAEVDACLNVGRRGSLLLALVLNLAGLVQARPEKAALVVLLSTLPSIVTIPFMLAWINGAGVILD